jgi:hypothetical protein
MDHIEELAKINAQKISIRRKDSINPDLPYFRVYKGDNFRYTMDCFNYKTHDNSDRMDLYKYYFIQYVFPNVDKDIDIAGFYSFELHDGHHYLKNTKKYDNTFVFSSPYTSEYSPALLPDPYFISNYNGLMNIDDTTQWREKKNKVCFYGTTTGNRNPLKNERIDVCLWSLKNRNIFDFKITKIAQMTENYIRTNMENFTDICAPNVTIPEQLKYKFHLIIDGNVSRFDVWSYVCNVVNLKWKSDESLFYYPLMPDKQYHVVVNKENIENIVKYYLNNTQEAIEIIDRAKEFANFMFRPIVAQYYCVKLFEEIGNKK